MSNPLIALLVDIAAKGKLGELRERFAYARRELLDQDGIALTHARLDAGNIGSVAAELLGVDADEATLTALDLLAPEPKHACGADLIAEFHAELFAPEADEATPAPTPKQRRDW